MQIRTAERKDLEKMHILLLELYNGDIGQNLQALLEEYIIFAKTKVLVAEEDSQVIGVLIGSYRLDIDYECRAGIIDAIIVQKNFRNMGIGKQMLSLFGAWALEQNCTMLQVMNPRSDFFDKNGFVERKSVFKQTAINSMAKS